MICYVDIEHEKVLDDAKRNVSYLAMRMGVQLRLEEISGEPCLVQRYTNVTRRRLREWNIRALVISGNSTDWEEYPEGTWDEMGEIIRAAEVPIIGLCGGCQLIAMAHGAPLGPLRRLNEGEQDPCPRFAPGYFKESGFKPVRILAFDPLFEGLGEMPIFLESHYWEVKQAPPGFSVLASTDDCPIQVIKRQDRPVYGVQFHPEGYTERPYDPRSLLANLVYPEGYPEAQPDGRRLLANFFKIAGVR